MNRDQFSTGSFGYTPRQYNKKKKVSTVQPAPAPTSLVPSIIPNEQTIDYSETPLNYANKGVNTDGLLPKPVMVGKSPNVSLKDTLSLGLADYNYDDIYNEIYSSGSSTGGATKVDVTALLNAYKQQADAANAVAQQTHNSKREQLLNHIKRAYAANDLARAQQSQNFINDQANLEAANMANARNARVQAGNMGLSGSGIQQLAQLKNLIGQANAISEVSNKNMAALEKLRSSLATTDEKAMAQLDDALNDYTTSILGNNSKMAKNSADIVMDAETAYANALRQANSSGSTYGMAANMVANTFNGMSDNLRFTLDMLSNMKTKELKQYAKDNGISLDGIKSSNYKAYLGKQAAIQAQQTVDALNDSYPISPSMYNTAYNNIASILKYYNL